MQPIVIVDDSHEDALLAHRVLTQCKIKNPIIVLNGGAACLDYFEGAGVFAGREVPCLMLLDVMMTPVSGIEVLEKLLESGAGKGSVIVMLSGLTELKTIHLGYQLGAKTFLIKPLATQDVVHMLNALPEIFVTDGTDGYELALESQEFGRAIRKTGRQIRAFGA